MTVYTVGCNRPYLCTKFHTFSPSLCFPTMYRLTSSGITIHFLFRDSCVVSWMRVLHCCSSRRIRCACRASRIEAIMMTGEENHAVNARWVCAVMLQYVCAGLSSGHVQPVQLGTWPNQEMGSSGRRTHSVHAAMAQTHFLQAAHPQNGLPHCLRRYKRK